MSPGADLGARSASPVAPTYECSIPYEQARIKAAAIYCSDGRVGEHFDDFLQNGLGLPRYDRVALPGGPACLADDAAGNHRPDGSASKTGARVEPGLPQARLQAHSVIDELNFLVEAHGLKRVILIAHEGCAYYALRLQIPQRRLELLQQADLVRAAASVRRVTGIDAVEAYYAHHASGLIRFAPIEV